MRTFILWPHEFSQDTPVGGKARSLALLAGKRLPVPPLFVILPHACEKGITSASSDPVARLAEPVRRDLEQALVELSPHGELLAVRSSAAYEDSRGQSFAGQLRSFVFRHPSEVPECVVKVWQSGFSEQVVEYLSSEPKGRKALAPAVIVQRMIEGDKSGVAFSADPISGRRSVRVVAAVRGHAGALVDGSSSADTWWVDRNGQVVGEHLASEPPEALPPGPVHRSQRRLLSQREIRAVADLAHRTEQVLHVPQDIEWTIQEGQLYLLQSRPITTLKQRPDPDGAVALWDNTNIVENYPGVITPLTFSFVRSVYTHVFRAFVVSMGVPRRIVEEHDQVFRGMVGLIRGRIYYNLLNWYRTLALLPCPDYTRRFFDEMLGVDATESDLIDDLDKWSNGDTLIHRFLGLGRTSLAIAINLILLRHRVDGFLSKLDGLLAARPHRVSFMRAEELGIQFRILEAHLLRECEVPALNDFYVMVFHGLLNRLLKRWKVQNRASLSLALLSGGSSTIISKLNRRVDRMADLARDHPTLVDILCNGDVVECEAALDGHPDLQREYLDYLERFGDRCVGELKLESDTLLEDPTSILRAVGRAAKAQVNSKQQVEQGYGENASALLRSSLRGQSVRYAVLRLVLAATRARLKDRENMRFARARIFGRARLLLRELGARFTALDLLDSPEDVHFLELEEILATVENRATTADLRGLAETRKREFAAYETSRTSANRFETRGIVSIENAGYGETSACAPEGVDRLFGAACSPGIVRGRVRIIDTTSDVCLASDEIAVAKHTDPGWIMVVRGAAGLLVERGNVLSHTAIVARELGIPMIASLPRLTSWLCDGDVVELDGTTGQVSRIDT